MQIVEFPDSDSGLQVSNFILSAQIVNKAASAVSASHTAACTLGQGEVYGIYHKHNNLGICSSAVLYCGTGAKLAIDVIFLRAFASHSGFT